MAQVMLREYLQGIEDTLSAGHIDDAESKCQRVLVRYPESLEVQRLLGEVYLAKGQMEKAQQALDWILTNDPENVIAYCDRALISERQSDVDTALDCYQQAYELSRGNRDIRQQFNTLSAKAAQQGFMFSRAGLARLYMRGDLLPQAIQEWEAVLSISPDRLDARTGLIEAYWREGSYDEAEELAMRTIDDVPGCTKALLILAHITAPKNMQLAQEYVQRAEMLDPDLLMAQELFEDMMMSQPGHPFLKLLRKAPAMLDTQQASAVSTGPQPVVEPVLSPVAALQDAPVAANTPIYEMPTSTNLFEWNNPNAWNSAIDTPLRPETSEQQSGDAFELPTWSHEMFADAPTIVPIPEQVPQDEPITPEEQNIARVPAQHEEQDLQSLHHLAEPSQEEQWQPEYEASTYEAATAASTYAMPTDVQLEQEASEPAWVSSLRSEAATPPSWLSMLTQDEPMPVSEAEATLPVPTDAFEEAHYPHSSEVLPPVDALAESAVKSAPVEEHSEASWHGALQSALDSSDDEEPFSFGPEWLKSLGAEELTSTSQGKASLPPISSQLAPGSEQTTSHEEHEPLEVGQEEIQQQETMDGELQPTEFAHEYYQHPEANYQEYSQPGFVDIAAQSTEAETHSWLDALSAAPESHADPDHAIISTLEDLEKGLVSEGFVPLEPNSLASIAQYQNNDLDIPSSPFMYQEEPQQHATLSSALEQLGNLAAPQAHYRESNLPTQSEETPLWASDYRIVPAPRTDATSDAHAPHVPIEETSLPDTSTSTPIEVIAEEPIDEVEHTETQLVEQPTPFSSFSQPTVNAIFSKVEPFYTDVSDVPLTPAARIDPFFESELETTMRRPAIRLEGLKQQRQAASSTSKIDLTPTSNGNGRSVQQNVSVESTNGTQQRLRERLVQGYQHQLVGDYDEAMQEYRIIIKGAPELLGEVVSNIRALLKIAPKYTAGYRVLGDAYMRQGEYLQAMEVYNKALTMAKKSKV